mmetsp:Transcript_19629/g.55188  ORF Transcript_19629/g.55188 Transcript_19629/m.55188 type:complete len:272 (-) Transcript_19629:48-863(-)
MVLWFVGLGLGNVDDITLKGLEVVKASQYIYLESYTSILPGVDRAAMVQAYGCAEVIEADRELVESGCEEMIERARDSQVSFLVVGDPLCATTHTDLSLRARKAGVEVRVVHNASVMNAIAACGLQLYRFGETVSIPYWTKSWRPSSFYDKIAANRRMNLHTLCLLDIKVKEQSEENLCRGRKIYEPPRFMSVQEALGQLAEIEEARGEGHCAPEVRVVGVARLGRDDQKMVAGTLSAVAEADLGGPLHSLVIGAPELHELEVEFLDLLQG